MTQKELRERCRGKHIFINIQGTECWVKISLKEALYALKYNRGNCGADTREYEIYLNFNF